MNLPRANYPAITSVYDGSYIPPPAARNLGRPEPTLEAFNGCPTAPPPDSPPLGIGDRCQLTGGSPTLLVVDVEPTFTVAWRSECGVSEHEIDRGAVRRA